MGNGTGLSAPVPGRHRGRTARDHRLSDQDYAARLAAQGGSCAICGNPPKSRRLDTDRDHRTGEVRGLLCHRCNRALPAWITTDWLIRAAEYLCGGSL